MMNIFHHATRSLLYPTSNIFVHTTSHLTFFSHPNNIIHVIRCIIKLFLHVKMLLLSYCIKEKLLLCTISHLKGSSYHAKVFSHAMYHITRYFRTRDMFLSSPRLSSMLHLITSLTNFLPCDLSHEYSLHAIHCITPNLPFSWWTSIFPSFFTFFFFLPLYHIFQRFSSHNKGFPIFMTCDKNLFFSRWRRFHPPLRIIRNLVLAICLFISSLFFFLNSPFIESSKSFSS